MTAEACSFPCRAGNTADFDVIGLTPPRLLDPAIAIAVSRAGGIGVLDLEWGFDEPWRGDSQRSWSAAASIQRLAWLAKGRWGIKLDGEDECACEVILAALPASCELVILTFAAADVLGRQIARLRQAVNRPRQILLEVTGGTRFLDVADIDGFLAKGYEAGGMVGDETTFILIQRLLKETGLPVWAHGGIGLHSAAACRAAGAAGVVLDSQLCLTRESSLPESVRRVVARMDGGDTTAIGASFRHAFRCFRHPGSGPIETLQDAARRLEGDSIRGDRGWRETIRTRIGWGEPQQSVWPLGQDAALASHFADRFETAGRVISAIRELTESHLIDAQLHPPFDEASPLAKSHGTRFPVVQGPMTRVSDNAAFARAVAQAGALPFIALALSNAAETRKVLSETRASLAGRPWGVGILGFVPLDVRKSQLEVIQEVKPTFALIAGGRPDQALSLESEGIPTYLHTPSEHLLKLFFEQGARRFVFEGRECGGHVGPRCSFVLWDGIVEALLSLREKGADLHEVHVLFAGGIHDSLSAAMVGALAAPLSSAGVKIGVLLGTAYLFTREVVECGAITPLYQQEAIRCERTALLESGPGHASRCARTSYVNFFEAERRRHARSGISADEMRGELEKLNLGRLRMAAKGVKRRPSYPSDPEAPRVMRIDGEAQRTNGMYMLGQVATLRQDVCSIEDLHVDVSIGSSARLRSLDLERLAQSNARPSNIAIIGASTLLPKAPDLQSYWENILAKVDAITEIPQHRFDWRQYYDPDPAKPDKIYSKWGGFLDDVVFDPMRYGMPPHVLPSIEPMQLLTLEAVRAAVADAGYTNRPFNRSRTSVILGAGGGLGDLGQQYGTRSSLNGLTDDPDLVPEELLDRLPSWTEDSFAGVLLNVAAGRVANRFDLGGVNFTVDAACASSLAAIYSAVRELESGSSDVVIAGGVDTVQNPFGYLCFSKTKALSPRGRCRPFDVDADGIVISEGLVVLVLKRLIDAERDGDRIYAVIKSIAGSSDGREKGLTAPRPEGQLIALQRAYEVAGIRPETVGLIEAHGTGTVAGDQAEVEALKTAFVHSSPQGCAIGSVKSMIGHTKCAAGAAGLVKAALALHEKVLPPTLHVKAPNPKMDFANSPFFINTEVRPWIQSQDQPRRAGVSAFGFGGTNFHVVLEEYAQDPLSEHRAPVARNWPSEILVCSAASKVALRSAISTMISELDRGAQPALVDLAAATWHAFKSSDGARLAIVATSLADLRDKLRIAASAMMGEDEKDLTDQRGVYLRVRCCEPCPAKLAFVFPGQGSQHLDMFSELAVYFSEVRECFEEADRFLASHIPQGITPYIFPPSQFTDEARGLCQKRLNRTEITQPAMGAACTAMLRLLESCDLRADIFAGHSYGEYVALAAAGAYTKSTLFSLSAARGKYMAEAAEPGTMLAAWETAERIQSLIAGIEGVWIANVNSPSQTVLSGTLDGINRAKECLSESGITSKTLPVGCAFHSPLVDGAKARLASVLAGTEFSSPHTPVFSNTTAKRYPEEPCAISELLAEHLVHPVRFMDEVEAMYEYGVRTFVEVGPRGVLTGLIGQVLENRTHLAVATGGERSSLAQLHHALAQLTVHGVSLSLDRLYRNRVERGIDLKSLLEIGTRGESRSNTWLVNGGRVRKFGEPALRQTKPAVFRSPLKPAAEPIAVIPSAAASESDAVMVRFQETMTHFLETQRRTMLSYLEARKEYSSGETRQTKNAIAPAAKAIVPTASSNVDVTDEQPSIASRDEAVASLTVVERLRCIISDRTGYPIEMLESGLNLESDLGIDSIKKVEILGAFQRNCNAEEQLTLRGMAERLTSLKTIETLADALQAALRKEIDAEEARPQGVAKTVEAPQELHSKPESTRAIEALPRFLLTSNEESSLSEWPSSLPDGVILVTDDGRGVASRLASELELRGWAVALVRAPDLQNPAAEVESLKSFTVELSDFDEVERMVQSLRQSHGVVAAVIHLLPLMDRGNHCWQRCFALETKGLFNLAKATARDLRCHKEPRSLLLAASCLGGSFGVSGVLDEISPLQGGIAGIVKTLALEWPEVTCKVVDFENGLEPSRAAEHLLHAVLSVGPVETGYQGTAKVHLQISPATLPFNSEPAAMLGLRQDSVVLVTGGARGITAKAAIALAKQCRGRFVLVGKSPLPVNEEAPETVALRTAQHLRSALIAQARHERRAPDPATIETAIARLLRDREIRSNLRAFRETGAEVRYIQCDLANAEDFGRVIDEVYSSCGMIHGVIHGAGVVEDRLAEEKSPESFDRVCGPKITGAMVLAQKLSFESVRFLAFFSSVSARFGNRGQADYAAANEVLNKLAAHLDARWPARVVAINWGPWNESNMVNDGVRDQFVLRGVQLIEDDDGCRAFIQEIAMGKKAQTEIILGGGPWGATVQSRQNAAVQDFPLIAMDLLREARAGEFKLLVDFDPSHHLYLNDHCLDARPVVPATMAIELMAEAVLKGWPELSVVGVRSVRVCKGIVVDRPPQQVCVTVCPQTHHSAEDLSLAIDVVLCDPDSPKVVFYRGTVCVTDRLSPARHRDPKQISEFGSCMSAKEAYDQHLFHGPLFQCLKRVTCLDEEGVSAYVSPSCPADCVRDGVGKWTIDPILLDAGPQLLILWAQKMRGATALPSRFGEVEIFDGYSQALLAGASKPLECRLTVDPTSDGTILNASFQVYGPRGEIVLSVEGLESTASSSLNRFAVRTATAMS